MPTFALKSLRASAAVLSLLVSLYCFGNSLWILAKAELAQLLIARAWQHTLQNGVEIKPWPWADTWPVGRLQIPNHGIDLYSLYGLSGQALAFGPGQLSLSKASHPHNKTSGTTRVLAGHRDTHFAFMEHLKTGEQLLFTQRDGSTTTFEIVSLDVVDSRSERIQASAGEELLLVTCYPFYSFDAASAAGSQGPLRYVARALPIASTPKLALTNKGNGQFRSSPSDIILRRGVSDENTAYAL